MAEDMTQMDERGLMRIWDMHNRRQTWRDVIDRGSNPTGAEKVIAKLDDVTALDALEANRRLVDLLTDQRWDVIREAREAGASWSQIGAALGMSTQGALDHYRHKIGEHEQALSDLHEAERFRTVVDDHTDEIEADRGP